MNEALNPVADPAKEKSAQMMWTGFILMFFVIQAIIWTVAITMTVGDQSHAVVADYDEKALNWNHTRALLKSSEDLGWNDFLQIKGQGDFMDRRTVSLTLEDRDRQPIENATVSLSAFHTGRAAQVQNIEMKPVSPGIYSGIMQIRRSGHWQFTGTATLNGQQFLINQRQTLKR